MLQLQDMTEYQLCLSREIEVRLVAKCDKLADAFIMDDNGISLSLSPFIYTRHALLKLMMQYVHDICLPMHNDNY